MLKILIIIYLIPSYLGIALTDRQRQGYLWVEYYNLEFSIFTDVKNINFAYSARTELHFNVTKDVDELLFDCMVYIVSYVEVLRDDQYPIENMEAWRDMLYFRIKHDDGQPWRMGHYSLIAYVEGPIHENPAFGIYYTLHYDRLMKDK